MSLLDAKQAWASSRFFTNKPISRRDRRAVRGRGEKSSSNVQFDVPDEGSGGIRKEKYE